MQIKSVDISGIKFWTGIDVEIINFEFRLYYFIILHTIGFF